MKTYKHKLYLIERTKLLEGIYCQSITFTNSLGNVYASNNNIISPTFPDQTLPQNFDKIKSQLYKMKSPVERYKPFHIPSINKVAQALCDLLQRNNGAKYIPCWRVNTQAGSYTAEIIVNGETVLNCSSYDDLDISPEITLNQLYSSYKYIFSCIIEDAKNNPESATDYFVMKYDLITSVENKYPLARWTITDVINRILQLAEPISAPKQARYTLNPAQETKYSKMFAPEFTMTQCNLREQLKVVGGYIHAEPRLGGYHDGEYHENMIFFDEYGSTEESNLKDKPYVYKDSKQSISQYCTDVQTNAQNIVNSLNYAQGVIIDPQINGDRTLRTESINIKLSESTSKVYTQLPIYKIEKVECGLYNTDNTYNVPMTDITPYVYEAYEYNSILSSYEGNYPYSKSYGIYYTQGQKGLDGLFFKTDNAVDTYFSEYAIVNILNSVTGRNLKSDITNYFPLLTFRVTYLPIYEAKFSQNKQLIIKGNKKFSQIYNQSENLVETSYYGENIKGVAQRLGNVEQTRTYIFKDITKIPKIKQCIDDYMISAVNTEIQWGYIKCTVALSKGFNRVSQYVGINSNKRIAEVSERQAYKRDILLKDYIVIGNTERPSARCFNNVLFALDVFKPNVEKNQISAVVGIGYTKTGTQLNAIRLPVISSAFGNSMLFSWHYKDNYSAGEQVANGTQNVVEGDETKKVQAYWQTDVPYCDYYGRMWEYMFALSNSLSFDTKQALTPINQTKATANVFVLNEPYLVRKDSREILNFNYEVEFVTNRPDLIIGSAMATNNPLVTGIFAKNTEAPKVYFFDEPINKFESKIDILKAIASDDIATPTNENGNLVTNAISIAIPNNSSIKSWAIVTPIKKDATPTIYQDEEGNLVTEHTTRGGEILLASNSIPSSYYDEIYFTGINNPYMD